MYFNQLGDANAKVEALTGQDEKQFQNHDENQILYVTIHIKEFLVYTDEINYWPN